MSTHICAFVCDLPADVVDDVRRALQSSGLVERHRQRRLVHIEVVNHKHMCQVGPPVILFALVVDPHDEKFTANTCSAEYV